MSNILRINIDKQIQEANDIIAKRIRKNRNKHGIPMIDIQGSVGSGKSRGVGGRDCGQE